MRRTRRRAQPFALLRFALQSGMEFRHLHAATLALLGWYLMMPPILDNKLYEHAPVSQWQIAASFDTSDDCAVKKKEFAAQSEQLRKDASPSVKLVARAEELAICIDSGDVRLKGY